MEFLLEDEDDRDVLQEIYERYRSFFVPLERIHHFLVARHLEEDEIDELELNCGLLFDQVKVHFPNIRIIPKLHNIFGKLLPFLNKNLQLTLLRSREGKDRWVCSRNKDRNPSTTVSMWPKERTNGSRGRNWRTRSFIFYGTNR